MWAEAGGGGGEGGGLSGSRDTECRCTAYLRSSLLTCILLLYSDYMELDYSGHALFKKTCMSDQVVGYGCRSAGRTNEILGRLQRRRAAAGAQAVARERKVNLMRKYRTGELPDVQQLSIAAFLAPLGKLNKVSHSDMAAKIIGFTPNFDADWTGDLACSSVQDEVHTLWFNIFMTY